MRKDGIKRIEALEMWCWRKILKISYPQHITNEKVLQNIEEERTIMKRITEQQKSFIGHNLRHPDNLLSLGIEERFIRKRRGGRKRCKLFDCRRTNSTKNVRDLLKIVLLGEAGSQGTAVSRCAEH